MKACPICENTRTCFERLLNRIRLLKCGSCGFVFADLEDSFAQEKNASYGQRAQEVYEERQGALDEVWFQRIVARFTKKLGRARLLDVGFGNGRLLNSFRQLGWECYGIDPSPWSQLAVEKYGFKYLPGRVEELVEGDLCFDLVVSTSTLEHISNPLAHVRSILALLQPGGMAYFSGVPNYGSWSVRLGISTFHSNTPPGHVNYFTPRSIQGLFERVSSPGQKVIIRTYGVPELHDIRDRFKSRRATGNPEFANGRNGGSEKKPGSLLRLLVAANYYAGKPLGLGDKLEVVVYS